SWSRAVYHLYVVRLTRRYEAQKVFAERGVGTGLHYPIPIHLQEAYLRLGYKLGDFPVSEQAASEILSLPMFPHLTVGQQEKIVEILLESCGVQFTKEV